jgi:hypothetical protein
LHGDSVLTHDEAEHDKGDELGGVGLGRSDADLRTGVDVDAAMRLAGDGAAHGVGDTQDQTSARLAISFGDLEKLKS